MNDTIAIAVGVLWILAAFLFALAGYVRGTNGVKSGITDCLNRQEQFYESAMKIVEEKSHTYFREGAVRESNHILTSCLREVTE